MSQFGIRIVPGDEVHSDPPCDYDFALLTRDTVLGYQVWVIERIWDRGQR